MKRKFYPLMAFLVLTAFVAAQQPSGNTFQTYQPKQGVKKKLADLKQSAARIDPQERLKRREEVEEKEEKLQLRLNKLKGFKDLLQRKRQSPADLNRTINQEEENGASQTEAAAAPASVGTQEIWSNFLASDFNETPFSFPPDPNGDVGPSQVAVITNNSLKVFEKKGVTDPPLTTPTGTSNKMAPEQFFITLDDFFSPLFTPLTFFTSDPRIHFDRLTKRWFIVAIEVTLDLRNNLVLIAVSDGERITDETSFTYYSFPGLLQPGDNPLPESLPLTDYPTLGIDKTSVLIGSNNYFFSEDFFGGLSIDSIHNMGYVIDKKMLTRGNLLVRSTILGQVNLYDFSYGGMFSPQAVHNADPQFSTSYFAGISYDLDAIRLATVGYNAQNVPISLTRSMVPVEPWNFPRDITAPGTPVPIDPLDSRLLLATIQKNKRTGKSSLWTAHAIGVNEKGKFVSGDEFVDKARTASRWYEIDNLTTSPLTPRLIRTGTQYDGTPSGRRATMYFNPSIMANGQGHVVLGGTTAAFDKYLNVFVAGRYYGETPGVLHPPVKATNSTAIYAPIYGFYFGRWGDYSYTVVDPMDDQTLWTFQEYADIDDSYGVRAVQLKAPPPAMPVSVKSTLSGSSEGVFLNTADQNAVIKGIADNRSGFFDPGSDPGGPGYNRLSVKSTKGVIIGNIRWISPTEIRCRIFVKGKAPGNYQLIITNPDGQFVTLDYVITADNTLTSSAVPSVNKIAASYFVASSAVYPNPTDNNFRLSVNAAKEVMTRVVITDVNGKQLSAKAQFLMKGTNTIDLSLPGVNKGTYIVAVYNADNLVIAAHRVIKD